MGIGAEGDALHAILELEDGRQVRRLGTRQLPELCLVVRFPTRRGKPTTITTYRDITDNGTRRDNKPVRIGQSPKTGDVAMTPCRHLSSVCGECQAPEWFLLLPGKAGIGRGRAVVHFP